MSTLRSPSRFYRHPSQAEREAATLAARTGRPACVVRAGSQYTARERRRALSWVASSSAEIVATINPEG